MSTAAIILVDGVSYAAWLFIISIGLTLVYGVTRVLNIAHGGFYSIGAYMAVYAIGLASAGQYGVAVQLALAGTLAVAVGALLGAVVERAFLSRLYRHQDVLILFATYAIFLILEDMTKLIWGGASLYANGPRDALGQVRLGDMSYPRYDVGVVLSACAIAAIVLWVLNYTRIGRCVTAVVHDREMSAAMGINVSRILTGTYLAGAALGTLAGAITAPKIAVSPGIGVDVIVLAFAVVVVGGLGSIGGAVVGALIIGLARATMAHLLPQFELFTVYGVMVAVLALRPYGLFARAQARKI